MGDERSRAVARVGERADKELVLQLVVRYLKYLIVVRAEKEKIQAEFKVGVGGGGEA